MVNEMEQTEQTNLVIIIQFVISLISHKHVHSLSSEILGTLRLSLHSKIGAGRCT